MTQTLNAAHSGTFKIGGELEINRLGFGAMRLTGPGIWGEPADPGNALRVLRRVVELGVNFIDTADAYGPHVNEEQIREALHPYADGLVIATKGAHTRQGPDRWVPVGRPEYLRQCVEMSLRRLKLERIDLWQLHRIDPKVPRDEQFGVIKEMQDEGKIRFFGLSEVTVEEIEAAQKVLPVVTVQNMYNLFDRQSEQVLDYCEQQGIGFIPWRPVAGGNLQVLENVARKHDATPAQVALAWLLKRSKVMLPIPGTSSIKHLEENLQGARLELSDEDFQAISAVK
ncbi:aldo/keto reductase [Deinococcus cellulosilyticus]|uniref:Oxidoreductase n=1 Tax=Deinococcus cellulosilyticus (strain DSM 18568 / NBRC 106333 / KACC 11606 / 5516J-15) TaxID=1223518 RepID=A0A511N1K1_DEIC1|nr:aldo/keto reductase [Deinococcus cellulosilyticus]GEM46745.1 oxidoreductase [Deinococcus cellulosilyticus NBRC 106333 = KACC 11606]